ITFLTVAENLKIGEIASQLLAEKQISYKSIFGAYVMRAQYELASWNQEQKSEEKENQQMIQETVEDYIEQA
ncbi:MULTISPECIES: hypothetical protein, partial [Clostridia]